MKKFLSYVKQYGVGVAGGVASHLSGFEPFSWESFVFLVFLLFMVELRVHEVVKIMEKKYV
jgi:hypothetical protein